QLAGRDGEQPAQPAVAVDAERLVVLAAVCVPAGAGVALLAVDVRLDGGPVAGPDVRHALADRQHFHAEFVPRDARVAEERHLAEVAGEVGAADADAPDADDRLARPRARRLGHIDDAELLRLGELNGFHTNGPQRTQTSTQMQSDQIRFYLRWNP